MKILSIMCDMLRPNILDFDNCSSDSYEQLLKNLGGTYYMNCFSQGPDTGRSMGCYWSGMIPQDNGCDTRAKYPKFYLQAESFLDKLVEDKYKLYFFTNPNEKILGILPTGYETLGIHNTDLDIQNFIKVIDMSVNNLYVHLALTDFHWALDDYGANADGVEKGLQILRDSITKFFKSIAPDQFDYIIIFSDHGFKYNIEFIYQEKCLLLNRDRSNTMMFIHKKGENRFNINNKLCSLIDVYPTIMDIIGKPYDGYGHSLFSLSEPEFIICEDHGDFLPKVNQTIEYWALIKKEVIYLRSYFGYFRDDGKEFDIDKEMFDKLLCNYSKSFKETFKQLNILELYKIMATDKSFYTNGEPRYIIKKYNIFKRLKRKMRWKTVRK